MGKLFFMLLILMSAACGNKKDASAKQGEQGGQGSGRLAGSDTGAALVHLTEAQWKLAGIATGRAETREISGVLKLSGAIDVPPQNMVSISVPMGGYLRSTNLLAGMHVSRGETIAVMEDQQYIQLQQDYLTAKVSLGLAQQEYGRQKGLNETKAGSDKVYQQAEADYRSKSILVKSLSEKLLLMGIDPRKLDERNLSRSIRIPSPIDGFVSKVNVNIGKYVNPSDVLFEIVNPNDIHLALTVFEKDLPSLAIGQKLVAYTNSDPARRFPCEIILIGRDFSKERSVEVHCHFKNYDRSLIPGMYMNAEVPVSRRRQDVLPAEAVVRYMGRYYIFVVKGERAYAMVEVVPGDTEGGYTAIASASVGVAVAGAVGVSGPAADWKNSEVVTKGAYTLLMQMKNGDQEED